MEATKKIKDLIIQLLQVILKMLRGEKTVKEETPLPEITIEKSREGLFKEAFEFAILLASQGIEENKDKDLIIKWWRSIGKTNFTEKTPWCTLGIHIPLLRSGLVKLNDLPRDIGLARGYLNDLPRGFEFVEKSDLMVGDIVVKWRGKSGTGGGPNGWMGHIGWFDGYTKDLKSYYCIGGNQNNRFNRTAYKSWKILGGVRVDANYKENVLG